MATVKMTRRQKRTEESIIKISSTDAGFEVKEMDRSQELEKAS